MGNERDFLKYILRKTPHEKEEKEKQQEQSRRKQGSVTGNDFIV